ncbi:MULTISPECIES: SGNH/GDSL hydrolase family protein [Mesorhizobium]|uniref:Endoglucanase n=1 Tax=Mesorhizobium denitrificans TaxID=2294114 RepID=A0A371XDD4_9HYPH|nr:MULTISPECIES: SGNH/GDSL hydrolase family protein [Mesorhizobium]RFC67203.1 hypothetical protein DY251_11600 [Mesorhizobium denitrificans]
MKKPIAFFAALLAALVAAAPSAHAENSYLQNIRLVGRFLVDGSRAAFEWPGSAIEINFDGSSLDLSLTDTGNNSMMVEVDGTVSRINLEKGRHDYHIVGTEKSGPHSVRLIRRTEAFLGATVLEDVRVNGTILPPAQKPHSLLVIGDSISTGYGVEGKDTKCGFSGDTENQYLTYAAVAARRFDADVISLAFSGKGLVQNYDGKTNATMADIYGRLLPSRTSDAPLPKSDVIIVHLGSNDYANGARPVGFVQRYLELLAALRENAPDAQIYAAIGPMLAGDDLDVALKSINEVVDKRHAEGDAKIATIQFTDPVGTPSRGCDWHPNEAGQAFMAEQLTAQIQRDLGWAQVE